MTLPPKWYGPAPCRNCRADASPGPFSRGSGALSTFSVASRQRRRRTAFIAAVSKRIAPSPAAVRPPSQPSKRTAPNPAAVRLSSHPVKKTVSRTKSVRLSSQPSRRTVSKTFEGEMAARPKGCGEMRLSQDLRRRQSATARSTLTSPITIGGPSTRIRCDEAIRWFRSLTISRTDSSSGTSASVS